MLICTKDNLESVVGTIFKDATIDINEDGYAIVNTGIQVEQEALQQA